MRITRDTVVVVTGASAGIGRAVATAFGNKGAKVALLAREPERLEFARQEIASMGTTALAIVVDVANEDEVEAAAERVERELGPIGIWVNNAMVTIVGPVSQISPQEFRRVSEVTYHGTVWGTMAALKRMRARNRGSIVQVGSAMAYRSIPLQAPYCGAKHAVRGFTEALRCELLHDKSRVHLSIVEMPAINTPQFEWCRTKLDHHPKPVGTVYQPEVAARAVLAAAQGGYREIYATAASAMAIWGEKLLAGPLDHLLAKKGYSGQQMAERVSPGRPDNLFQPVPGNYAAHGRFDQQAKPSSKSLWLSLHKAWLIPAAAVLAAGCMAAAQRKRIRSG